MPGFFSVLNVYIQLFAMGRDVNEGREKTDEKNKCNMYQKNVHINDKSHIYIKNETVSRPDLTTCSPRKEGNPEHGSRLQEQQRSRKSRTG